MNMVINHVAGFAWEENRGRGDYVFYVASLTS